LDEHLMNMSDRLHTYIKLALAHKVFLTSLPKKKSS
jgi:hypothetical protein